DRFEIAEMLGQKFRRRLADMPDAERGQEARQHRILAPFELPFEIFSGLLRHPVEAGQFLRRECVEIGDILYHAAFDELVDELLPEPLDVHRAARAEELEALLQLGRAR